MTTDALLDVRDARCVIPTPKGDIVALGGVDLPLAGGEVLGLVGESGSGKSTLAKFVIGAPPPGARTSGRTTVKGVDLAEQSPERARELRGRHIGTVFQDPMMALNPVVPIGRQISEAPRFLLGMSARERRDLAVELLTLVGIPEPERRLKHYPHQFSGGMRQRVTIAMALACSPDILIADEATTALDVTVQRQILDLLADLVEQRSLAMVLVSHDLSVIAGRTHTTAVMYAGRIVEYGPTARVFAAPRHPYTRALLEAIPRLDADERSRMVAIPRAPPDLAALDQGCSFAPRCALATDACRDAFPEPRGGDTHWARCIHTGEQAE
ncbi:oligopeptide/dipeptide ABC transporter ATP-binding protein [Lipingzhangella halophila]|uniref:Oligopeptide/dipeptide ABC transporter ATP-binding protein n=1 Tax=Lipingzhangella halophila TaxID=1783352 RepID=A0A7W7RJ12_9ACTN|nr:ABC transporter ATP-binding protein [Lipingzhangella halophila]MBB4932889.1 oligopeptide/dipeptide ABC transporter ATP-binding protein [Lipingzhangella halophila]